MLSPWLRSGAFAAAFFGAACHRDVERRGSPAPPAHPSAAASGARLPAAAPPKIAIDGRGCTIDDKDFPGPPEASQEAATASLRTKPLVAGESVVVTVAPPVRVPRVAAMAAALEAAGARDVLVRSQARNGSDEQIRLALHREAAAKCAVAMTIEPDLVVHFSAGGAVTDTVGRGERGLDVAGAGATLARRLLACGAPQWTLQAGDPVPWSDVVSVVVASRDASDAATSAEPLLVPYVRPDAGPLSGLRATGRGSR